MKQLCFMVINLYSSFTASFSLSSTDDVDI